MDMAPLETKRRGSRLAVPMVLALWPGSATHAESLTLNNRTRSMIASWLTCPFKDEFFLVPSRRILILFLRIVVRKPFVPRVPHAPRLVVTDGFNSSQCRLIFYAILRTTSSNERRAC
jgi:hypothetical protein